MDSNANGKVSTDELLHFYKHFGSLKKQLQSINNNISYMEEVVTTYKYLQKKRTDFMELNQQKEGQQEEGQQEEGQQKEGQQAFYHNNSFLGHCFDKSIII